MPSGSKESSDCGDIVDVLVSMKGWSNVSKRDNRKNNFFRLCFDIVLTKSRRRKVKKQPSLSQIITGILKNCHHPQHHQNHSNYIIQSFCFDLGWGFPCFFLSCEVFQNKNEKGKPPAHARWAQKAFINRAITPQGRVITSVTHIFWSYIIGAPFHLIYNWYFGPRYILFFCSCFQRIQGNILRIPEEGFGFLLTVCQFKVTSELSVLVMN